MYSWTLTSKYYVNFLSVYSYHRRPIMHQRDTMEENKKPEIFLTIWKQWFGVSTEWMLRKQVFWVIAPCGLVITSWRLDEAYHPHPPGNEWIHGLITLKTKPILALSEKSPFHKVFENIRPRYWRHTVKTLVFESNSTELKFIWTGVRVKLYPSEVLQLVRPDFTELSLSPVHTKLCWFKASQNWGTTL
jgi:hypothetical protein